MTEGYTTRRRVSREEFVLPKDTRPTPLSAEFVYSWRSRPSWAKEDPDTLGDLYTRSNFGIRNPRSSGTVFDIVADRQRWLRELDQTFGGVKTPTDQSQCTVYSKTDTGHYFRSLKWHSFQHGVYSRERGGVPFGDPLPIFASLQAYAPQGWPDSSALFPFSTSVPGVNPPQSERQARLNQVFAAMAPQAPVAQIGETVISLLKGEFPRLLGNLTKLITSLRSSYRDVPRYVGGEYLNSVFNWQPLIRDFENAIKVLLAVDRLIYGSAFRRHRALYWDNTIVTSRDANVSSGHAYRPWAWGATSVTPLGNIGDARFERVTTSRFDIRLSAQLAPIARPGIGANDFVNQAADKLQMLGVWYPALGWDLLPYSWLVDWFVHLGSAISNASYYGSASGQTTIDYAWATYCLRVNTQVNFPVARYPAGSGITYLFRGSPLTQSVAKWRDRATPFGFGVDLSALTGNQIAILVALGLAKVR